MNTRCRDCGETVTVQSHRALSGDVADLLTASSGAWICPGSGNEHAPTDDTRWCLHCGDEIYSDADRWQGRTDHDCLMNESGHEPSEVRPWWVVIARAEHDKFSCALIPVPDLAVGPYPGESAAVLAMEWSLLIEDLMGDTKEPLIRHDCTIETVLNADAERLYVDLADRHHTGAPDTDDE